MESDLITETKVIYEDDHYVYWEYTLEGYKAPIKVRQDKESFKVVIDQQSIFEASGGQGNVDDFLLSDEGLDMLNGWEEKTGVSFFQMYEKLEIPEKNGN
ncbi:MAG TPA: hypothetical protein VHO50_07105 [Bacteroidales bacterium]|nr:hypothetical protein [Bacteroidales bacterium]